MASTYGADHNANPVLIESRLSTLSGRIYVLVDIRNAIQARESWILFIERLQETTVIINGGEGLWELNTVLLMYSTSRNRCNNSTLRLTFLPLALRHTSLYLEFFRELRMY